MAQGFYGIVYGRVSRHRQVFGSHAAGGSVFLELEQIHYFLALLRFHLHQNLFCSLVGQISEQVSGGVRLHLLDNLGGTLRVQ